MKPYAGIEDARRPGIGVVENAARLQRYRYVEERLLRILCGHLPGVARIEAKHAFARHAFEDSLHADAWRRRIPQLRTPSSQLDGCPDPHLEVLLDELAAAGGAVELLAGTYEVVKPALAGAYARHIEETNPLVDFPTVRELRIALAEEQGQIEWGRDALATLRAEGGDPGAGAAFAAALRGYLEAAGGIAGPPPAEKIPERSRSREPKARARPPVRDSRFKTLIEFDDHPLFKESPQAEKNPALRLMKLMWGRYNEVGAMENIAMTVFDAEGRPFEFHRDLARHLWDEARHSIFGQVILEARGYRIEDVPMRLGNPTFYTTVTPLERYALLGVGFEADLMKYPPGKRDEFEFCRDIAKDPLAACFQDYDWADEVLHTQIARRHVSDWMDGADFQTMRALAMRVREALNAYKAEWKKAGRPPEKAPAAAAPAEGTPGEAE